MIDALRRRLETEYNKTPDIWERLVDTNYKGMGKKPIKLTEEQIEFVNDLLHHELLPWTTVSRLFGYKDGSAGFKRILDREGIVYSGEELEERRLAHKRVLTPFVETVINKTRGHLWIKKYLDENKWNYHEEWSGFEDNPCFNSKTGNLLRFDFYIEDFNLVVEFHGRQHYTSQNYYHKLTANKNNISQEDAYNQYVERDKIKYNWAMGNKLEYLEISYTLYNKDFPLHKIFTPYMKG